MMSSRIKIHSFSQWLTQIMVKCHHMCPAKFEVGRTSLGELCKNKDTQVRKSEQCVVLLLGSFFFKAQSIEYLYCIYIYLYISLYDRKG